MISFWGLFLLSLITPSITIFRGGWMWFMRGLIEGLIYKKVIYFNKEKKVALGFPPLSKSFV